jgi:hypothetical protein
VNYCLCERRSGRTSFFLAGMGSGLPTNNTAPSNMVQVTGDVYDGGSVGDSNLRRKGVRNLSG